MRSSFVAGSEFATGRRLLFNGSRAIGRENPSTNAAGFSVVEATLFLPGARIFFSPQNCAASASKGTPFKNSSLAAFVFVS